MASDTITLALDGEVTLELLSRAFQHLAGLVLALTQELGGGVPITWIVDQLDAGSALATVRGEAEDTGPVERVVRAYADIGEALAQRRAIGYGQRAAAEARGIAQVLDSSVRSIRFETPDRDITVVSPEVQGTVLRPMVAYGSLEGRVQTLSSRGRLRFTVYDVLNDRAVSCYVDETNAELIRNVWGKRVVVEGLLTRDPVTGQPTAVRDITRIEALPDVEPGSYRRAIGALDGYALGLTPEEAIRRLRDAE